MTFHTDDSTKRDHLHYTNSRVSNFNVLFSPHRDAIERKMTGEIIGASIFDLVEEESLDLGIPIEILVVDLRRATTNVGTNEERLDDSAVLVPWQTRFSKN